MRKPTVAAESHAPNTDVGNGANDKTDDKAIAASEPNHRACSKSEGPKPPKTTRYRRLEPKWLRGVVCVVCAVCVLCVWGVCGVCCVQTLEPETLKTNFFVDLNKVTPVKSQCSGTHGLTGPNPRIKTSAQRRMTDNCHLLHKPQAKNVFCARQKQAPSPHATPSQMPFRMSPRTCDQPDEDLCLKLTIFLPPPTGLAWRPGPTSSTFSTFLPRRAMVRARLNCAQRSRQLLTDILQRDPKTQTPKYPNPQTPKDLNPEDLNPKPPPFDLQQTSMWNIGPSAGRGHTPHENLKPKRLA